MQTQANPINGIIIANDGWWPKVIAILSLANKNTKASKTHTYCNSKIDDGKGYHDINS